MDQAVTLVKEMPSRMGSWAAFFDPKQFSMPSSNLKERLKGNLGGFYANYVVVSVILLTYCLLTSPMLLMGVIIYGLLAYVIINRGQDLSIMGQAVTPNQQLFCLTLIFMPIFLLLGFTGVFFWVSFCLQPSKPSPNLTLFPVFFIAPSFTRSVNWRLVLPDCPARHLPRVAAEELDPRWSGGGGERSRWLHRRRAAWGAPQQRPRRRTCLSSGQSVMWLLGEHNTICWSSFNFRQ